MSFFLLDFNEIDHSFCESTIYGNPPEYINSISALFLSFIGFFGIMMNKKINKIKFVYSAMIINGLCSFMYHYTNSIGWGLMDRFSMVLIAIPCYFLSLDFFNLSKKSEPFGYERDLSLPKELIRIFITLYITILLTSIGLHNETLFNYLFGFFLISIFFFLMYLESNNKKLLIPRNILNIGWKGIFYLITAGIFWILTEKLCYKYYFIKYLFGHSFWHIGISYGGYLMSLVPVYLYDKDNYLKLDYYLNIPYIVFFEN